jgi:hypothetical protein
MTGGRPPQLKLCQHCVVDPAVIYPRNVLARCLICGQRLCADHIAPHLRTAHRVAIEIAVSPEPPRSFTQA